MSRFIISGGKVFEETSQRFVISGNKVMEDRTVTSVNTNISVPLGPVWSIFFAIIALQWADMPLG